MGYFTLKLLPFDLVSLRKRVLSFIHPFGCKLSFDIFFVLELLENKFLMCREGKCPHDKNGSHAYLHLVSCFTKYLDLLFDASMI